MPRTQRLRQQANQHGKFSVGIKVDETTYQAIVGKTQDCRCSIQDYVSAVLKDHLFGQNNVEQFESRSHALLNVSKLQELLSRKWNEWDRQTQIDMVDELKQALIAAR